MNTEASAWRTLALLADGLDYPGPDIEAWSRWVETALRDLPCPEARAAFHCFADAYLRLNAEAREELNTATFDVTPACVPYVSIHLFGEQSFKRGKLMAALKTRYAQTGFDARGELPDHLAVLLRFAAQTEEAERRELVEYCLLGPVGQMANGLGEQNPYQALLRAIHSLLQAAHPDLRLVVSPLERRQTTEAYG